MKALAAAAVTIPLLAACGYSSHIARQPDPPAYSTRQSPAPPASSSRQQPDPSPSTEQTPVPSPEPSPSPPPQAGDNGTVVSGHTY
jgi:hypothetical protein